MKKIIFAVLVTTAMYVLPSCNNAENSANKTAKEENKEKFNNTDEKPDVKFAMEAASGGMMEVELGNLAMANGSSAAVKDFGKDMVTDHTKANDELKSMAATKTISLPATTDNDKQKKIDDLKQKTGQDFDKAYIDLMVSDHKDDIDLFQKEADKGNDPDVKSWASGKVPTLQHHLMMAEDIQKSMKK